MSTAPEAYFDSMTDEERAAAWDALLDGDPPPMITKSIEAFQRDLPELLKTHCGWWVAYHGDERLGFGRRETPLYQECLQRGLSRKEFIVWAIDPSELELDDEIEASLDV